MTPATVSPSFTLDLLAQTAQLRRTARRRASGHDDLADDLVQETLIRAWAHRDRFAEGTNMGAWLHTILRNTHISHIRKASREQVGIDPEWEARLSCPSNQEVHIALVEVAEAMESLSESDRQALLVLGAEGRPHKEFARAAGCALGTVRSRLSRARRHLRTALENGIRGSRQPAGVTLRPAADEGKRRIGAWSTAAAVA